VACHALPDSGHRRLPAGSAAIHRPETFAGETAMLKAKSASGLAVACAVLLVAACTQPSSNTAQAPQPRPKPAVAIVAPKAPPPPPPEQVPPKPPAPDGHFVWNPGHYHWNYTASTAGQDSGFTWLPGHFVERPYPTSVWTNGNWTQRDGAWGWTPGYWQ
jgi:hypothetical protein